MDYQILKLTVKDNIGLITISRPEAMNALNTRFFIEMNELLKDVSVNPSIRVLVITGEGKAFVAGADIAEMVNKNQDEGKAFSRMGQDTFQSLEKLNIPVIAAINGFALGGGMELAMGCDIRIASEKAKFGQPEVNLGLIPGYAGTQRLPRLIGLSNALYLLLTGEMINAQEAFRIGLVQRVFAVENFLDEVMKVAGTIVSKGPEAIRLVKKVSREGLALSFEDGNQLEADHFGSLFGAGSEGEEGMKAFLEKRKPAW